MIAVFRPTRPGDADAVLRCVRMLRAVRAVIERRGFCPTGKGGGVDNSCGSGGGGGAPPQVKAWAEKKFAKPEHAKAFAEWFGDSKVVDDRGEPLLIHKGMLKKDWKTGQDIVSVESTNGPWAGFFSDDKQVADKFASAFRFAGDTQIVSGYASIKKPYVIDAQGKPAKSVQFDAIEDSPSGPRIAVSPRIKKIIDSGDYDGIVIKNTSDEGNIFVPFNPESVKSKDNKGSFDPKSKDFRRSLQRRGCGANADGGGGFQPGNTCGKGDGAGGSDDDSSRPPHGTSADDAASSTTIKSEAGDIVQTDRSDVNGEEYLDEIERDGEDRGLVVEFDQAQEMQESADLDVEDNNTVAAYAGAAYEYFTGQDVNNSNADEVIDSYGFDHGSFDSETASLMVDDRMFEAEREWEELDKTEWNQDWDSLSEDEQEESKDEWMNDKRMEVEGEVEKLRDEARSAAVESMRRELESGTAASTLACCMQLYRGIRVPEVALNQMLQDGYVVHEGCNSWTTSRGTAKTFSGGSSSAGGADRPSIVLVARKPRVGLVNTNDSLDEKEVIRPPSRMRIQRVVKTKTKIFLYVDEDEDYKAEAN